MSEANMQSAIYALLTGDATLMAMVKSVDASKPQPEDSELDSVFPYVTIGEDDANAWDTSTFNGHDVDAQIDIWSRSNNFIEAKQISGRIHTLLHAQPLTISGASHVLTLVEGTSYTKDPDGKTKRGLMLLSVKFKI